MEILTAELGQLHGNDDVTYRMVCQAMSDCGMSPALLFHIVAEEYSKPKMNVYSGLYNLAPFEISEETFAEANSTRGGLVRKMHPGLLIAIEDLCVTIREQVSKLVGPTVASISFLGYRHTTIQLGIYSHAELLG